MALNKNNKELNKKKYRIFLCVFLSFLFIYNIIVFMRYISSNSSLLTAYQSPIDELRWFRKPLVVLKFKNDEDKTKIVILPDNIIYHPHLKTHKSLFVGYDKIVIVTNPKTTEKHFDYIKNFSDNVLQSMEMREYIVKDNVLAVVFEDIENPTAGYEKIKNFAIDYHLQPEVSDILDTSRIKNILNAKNKNKHFSLQEQYQNIENFVKDFKIELGNFLLENNNKKDYPKQFYDKASTLVYACDNQLNCKEFADFSFEKSLVKSLTENMTRAQKEGYIIKKIFLLTQLEKQKFKTEEDMLGSLDTSIGVFIKNGSLSGVMLPVFWEKYKSKKDFINQLKIKSGLSPDYFSDIMDIYYFKAVEMPYED